MPEGDTIYRTAVALRRAVLHKQVLHFESSVEGVAAVEARSPVVGRTVGSIDARGKHLLIAFHLPSEAEHAAASPEILVLHSHMRMTGSWHLYRHGEAWQKPSRYAKVVFHTAEWVVPCFSAPVVELLTHWQALHHPDLTNLGPDAMTADFDADEARRRLLSRPDVQIGVALLNQRLLAGVGNVYKSEVLFIRRVSPFVKVGDLEPGTVESLVQESHRLLRLNQDRGARRTHFGLNEQERLWVYGRSGEPCRVCRSVIRMRRQGLDARSTYYCPHCQNTCV